MEGVTRYHELFRNMKRQHKRIVNAVGQEEFNTILQRFPVVLDDGAVIQVAESLGWNSEWLRSASRAKAKAKALAAPSADLAVMLARAGPVPGAVAPVSGMSPVVGVAPSRVRVVSSGLPAAPPAAVTVTWCSLDLAKVIQKSVSQWTLKP